MTVRRAHPSFPFLRLLTEVPGHNRPGWAAWRFLASACLLATLSTPAWSANTGGSTDTDCDTSGYSYIGTCSTDSNPASGGDVSIDTPPISGTPPDPVLEVAGGVSVGNAINNRIRISGTSTYDSTDFTGGHSCEGDATDNSVLVGGQVTIQTTVIGGDACVGRALSNTVTVGEQARLDGALIVGGMSNIEASNNTVIVRDQATVLNSEVFGGISFFSGTSKDNTVMIRDQAAILDGSVIYGGSSFGDAIGNTVVIRDQATVLNNSQIFGGSGLDSAIGNAVMIRDQSHLDGALVAGGLSMAGNATHNTITIRDQARVENSVIIGGMTDDGLATHNRIILQGSPALSGTALIGGISTAMQDDVTGNTLEIHSTGLQAAGVANFDHYRYVLPAGVAPGTPILSLTNFACLCDATVSVDMIRNAVALQPGTRITLMHADGLASNRYSTSPTYITGRQGLALTYRWGLTTTATDLIATVDSVNVNPESKAPLEGRAASLALINQGADMVAGMAMDRARGAAQGGQWSGFGAIGGGHSRYDSGSHVDVDGLSFVLGTARRFGTGHGSLAVGGFVELGYGRYDSTNDFGYGRVHGEGKSRYEGLGLMVRHDFSEASLDDPRGPLGLYIEGSARLGRAHTDWHSADLNRVLGADASYDSTTPYYGAHLGLGYVVAMGARASSDWSLKYFWNHQNSDQVSIAGDTFDFEASDSQRLRIGTRLRYLLNDHAVAYAGAAWEHEFEGGTQATVYGFQAPSPSLKGDTGVFEVGLDITPKQSKALSLNLGIQAYTGQREGLGGTLQLKYAF